MSEVLTGIIFVGFQHIVTILVGMASIYLGYRLFLEMPERREGETKLALPGGISILLSRVGPGIFFALFGAAMIVYSVTKPIEVNDVSEDVVAANGAQSTRIVKKLVGVAPAAGNTAGGETRSWVMTPMARSKVMAELNRIAREAENRESETARANTAIAVRQSKLMLMREAWQPDWGPYENFHLWVTERFARDPIPAGLAEAAAYYRQGV